MAKTLVQPFSSISGRLVLNDGVLVLPVTDLPAEARTQIDCKDSDFAISRINARNGSKVVDADGASLLARFEQERSVVEAVILFAREKRVDPEKVLDTAFPFLRDMVAGGFLIASDQLGKVATDEQSRGSELEVGTVVPNGRIARTLQVLEDTEVYLVAKPGGSFSVFKIERVLSHGSQDSIRYRLQNETAILTHLGGSPGPALLDAGEFENRRYLEMEFVAGVDAATAAAECREGDAPGARCSVLALVREVARAYAALHARGILHGDVHPSNVLVQSSGAVQLIDFGVAGAIGAGGALPMARERGGIPFFYEPELARGWLAGAGSVPASEAGEQHAVAALIYLLVTGGYWQNFRLGRQEMLSDIATLLPLTFSERGVAPWPELESVLTRALSKEPAQRYPSLQAFTNALCAIQVSDGTSRSNPTPTLESFLGRALADAAPEGAWSQSVLSPAPTTSINYGSSGIALGLLQMALVRSDAQLLAWSDSWARRAAREMKGDDAFFNEKIEITAQTVGHSSPFHSPSGIHAVAALIGHASADIMSQAHALAAFLKAAEAPAVGLDLTLGKSSLLLGTALLLDVSTKCEAISSDSLKGLGNRLMAEIWAELDKAPHMREGAIEYLGIAHGWAGFLYATLLWCDLARSSIPQGVARRLSELATLCTPVNRGLDWPWTAKRPEQSMPGWCNGACGYVFLWTLAHRVFGEARFLDLAVGAGWRSWEAASDIVSLCCGVAGRAYALLNLYRHTAEEQWLERARHLAVRGSRIAQGSTEYVHSLYKGNFGLVVLIADLDRPNEARMPFFEPLGYSR